MRGVVHKGFKDFVGERFGEDAWQRIQEGSGNRFQLYLPVTEYPDELLYDQLEAAVELTGIDQSTLLYEFGQFLVAELIDVYGVFVDQDWTGLDLLVNVEAYIHEALRAKQGNYTPPEISSRQLDEQRVLVTYESDRGLCPLTEGIIVGVGDYYDEAFVVEERSCKHDGDPQCAFLVTANNRTTTNSTRDQQRPKRRARRY